MLNLKKGLAVVLAAATALTFAPVSTLGLTGVVQAQAALNATDTGFAKTAKDSFVTNELVNVDPADSTRNAYYVGEFTFKQGEYYILTASTNVKRVFASTTQSNKDYWETKAIANDTNNKLALLNGLTITVGQTGNGTSDLNSVVPFVGDGTTYRFAVTIDATKGAAAFASAKKEGLELRDLGVSTNDLKSTLTTAAAKKTYADATDSEKDQILTTSVDRGNTTSNNAAYDLFKDTQMNKNDVWALVTDDPTAFKSGSNNVELTDTDYVTEHGYGAADSQKSELKAAAKEFTLEPKHDSPYKVIATADTTAAAFKTSSQTAGQTDLVYVPTKDIKLGLIKVGTYKIDDVSASTAMDTAAAALALDSYKENLKGAYINGSGSSDNGGTIDDNGNTVKPVYGGDSREVQKNDTLIPQSAFGKGTNNKPADLGENVVDGVDHVYRLAGGFYLRGLKIQGENTKNYQLFNAKNVTLFHHNAGSTSKKIAPSAVDQNSDISKVNGQIEDKGYLDSAIGTGDFQNADTIIVDAYVTDSPATFTLEDRSSVNQSAVGQKKGNAEIDFTIKAEADRDSIDGIDIVPVIYPVSDSDNTGKTWYNEIHVGPTTLTTDAHNNGIYELQLNEFKYGYSILGLGTDLKANSWTGVQVDGVDISIDGDLDTTQHIIANNYYKQNGTTLAPAYKYNSTTDEYSDLASATPYSFKATAITNSVQTINVVAKDSSNNIIATKKLDYTIDRSENAIDYITYTDVTGTKYTNNTLDPETRIDPSKIDTQDGGITGNGDSYRIWKLSQQVRNSGSLKVKAEGVVSFKSSNPAVIEVTDNGDATASFKVVAPGDAYINVYVGQTANNQAKVATINTTIGDWGDDLVTAEFTNGSASGSNHTDLDVPGQTKGEPVFTDTLKVKSYAGQTPSVSISSGNDKISLTPVAGTKDEYTVTALKAGSATITVSSADDKSARVNKGSNTATVTVWSLPSAKFTVSPVSLTLGQTQDLTKSVSVEQPDPKTAQVRFDSTSDNSVKHVYDLTNEGKYYSVYDNSQYTSLLTARNVGKTTVKATVLGVAGQTRPTTKNIDVTVLSADIVNTITVTPKSFNLKVGETAQASATSSANKAVTFTTKDSDIIDVTTGGAITAKAVGNATIVASAEGAQAVEIPVVVTGDNDEVAVPAKVSKVVVRNVKGAKAKISYSQLADVDGYKVVYKYKKNGKTVRKTFVNKAGKGSKTVSVPKNTSVKVWVRAFRLNSKGQRVNAPYKTKTFKTDNK